MAAGVQKEHDYQFSLDPHATALQSYAGNDNYGGNSGYSGSINSNSSNSFGYMPPDWYRDANGTAQYNPYVHDQASLDKLNLFGISGQYLGKTYMEKTKLGIVNYRMDGSIWYTNQTDAYRRIYYNSKLYGNREEFLAILNKGYLVLPNYKNTNGDSEVEKYGYSWQNGNLIDAVTHKKILLLATMHTHLRPTGDADPSFDDVATFSFHTANKPFLTIGYDGVLYGDYGTWQNGFYKIDFQHYRINNALILRGFLLREFLKEYMQKVLK